MKAFRLLMFLALVAFSHSGMAQSVTINAGDAPYNLLPAVRNITVRSDVELRIAALSAAAGAYRHQFGLMALSKLPAGSQFKMIYEDGSSERAVVDSQTSSLGTVPVPGTQRDADGNLIASNGGGSGSNGGSNGGIGIIGYRPVYVTATVCSGGVCTSQRVLVGYEPIYGRQVA